MFRNIPVILLLICFLPDIGFAQDVQSQPDARLSEQEELVVGTKVAPPFVVRTADGELEGISIDLWRQMADELGVRYRFEEASLSTLFTGLQNGTFDLSLAALTVNAEREEQVDFTHPFFTTGLAIAVPSSEGRIMSAVSGFFSWEFFAALGGLCILLLAVGALLWLFERKNNSEQFGGTAAQGLGSSFWWAAVTMTTVGYGDKAPTTLGGRVIGFFWMFAAIILISSFTAAIATSLTVSQLETSVQGIEDLPDVRVTTLGNSASAAFLKSQDIRFRATDNLTSALNSLQLGERDALVYDKPILQFMINQQFQGEIQILPEEIDRQDYAIALPPGSPLREQLNTKLLEVIEQDSWQDILDKYLGNE